MAATFGVKIIRYNAYNGIFAEQPFIKAIEYSKHTIQYFGVGYHNKNAIVERNIQTLTLGARKLILNEKYIIQRQ